MKVERLDPWNITHAENAVKLLAEVGIDGEIDCDDDGWHVHVFFDDPKTTPEMLYKASLLSGEPTMAAMSFDEWVDYMAAHEIAEIDAWLVRWGLTEAAA